MLLSLSLMFVDIKALHINGIMGFSDHCFDFYISDIKKYTSINGFNSNFNKIYSVLKGLVSDCHLFLTYISGRYGHKNIPKYTILQLIEASTLVALLN